MTQILSKPSRNLLLNALSSADRSMLDPYLKRVRLEKTFVMVHPHMPIEHIYFIESGVASIVSSTHGDGRTEVGIFGRDGMSGTAVLLGADSSPHETFVQVGDCEALRLSADAFRYLVERSASLRTLLLRYVQTLLVQSACSTLSNAHHRIEARLARWLLMCHDRVDGDTIRLTHEFMSLMIAAQRTGVTVSLHILEGVGMIRSKRGQVDILDRARLVDLAGDAYGAPEAEYSRLIAPFGDPAD